MKLQWLIASTMLILTVASATEFPSAEQVAQKIRHDHPRLFLTPEELTAFRTRANTVCKPLLDDYRKEVDALPDQPKLEARPNGGYAEMAGDKIVVKKHIGDQDELICYINRESADSGFTAVKCAIVYLASGERKYRDKAVTYLNLLRDGCALARRSGMMFEWRHTRRLSGLIACDWLYNDLTPAERSGFLVPMLEYAEHLLQPGYQTNGGFTFDRGNYGEMGLLWPLCLTAADDGFDGKLVDKLFAISYRNEVGVMRFRESMSDGTGLLSSICSGYSFGFYPYASYNFLHTLKSATGIDGTKYFPQMRDYATYFNWLAIPNRKVPGGYCEFGWGDAHHIDNRLTSDFMYTHLAQLIHFFGKSDPARAATARAVMARLPESIRGFKNLRQYPFLPFILTGFEPAVKNPQEPEHYLPKSLARFFPAYGLTIMRSGVAEDDTYAAFKGGQKAVGHQHYDELSFILYKNGFQALDSGIRDGEPHHWAYYPRTVAHNSLLIRMADEPMPAYWYPSNGRKFDRSTLRNDGGQDQQLGAVPLPFCEGDGYVVTGGDATKCYSAKKCREAVRQFVFIKPDYFVVYDRVESVAPDQRKVFLLHTQNEPESVDGVWRSSAGEGRLWVKTLLPEQAKTEVIGGPGREFWTNNQNFPVVPHWAAAFKGPNWMGRYRLEISPVRDANQARFLHVLQVSGKDVNRMIPVKLVRDDGHDGVELTLPDARRVNVMFAREGKPVAVVTEASETGKTDVTRPLRQN